MSYKEFNPKMRIRRYDLENGQSRYTVQYGVECWLGFTIWHKIGWDRTGTPSKVIFSPIYALYDHQFLTIEAAESLFTEFVAHVNKSRRTKAGNRVVKETIVK